MKRRAQRVGDTIRETIADLLLRRVKDPRVGMVTLTDVSLSGDLRHAWIRFSVFGDEARRAECLAGLRSASGFLRSALAQRLNLRVAPELVFEFDPGLGVAAHVSQLLKQVLPEDQGG